MGNNQDNFLKFFSIIKKMYNDIKEFYQHKSEMVSVKIFKVVFPILLIVGIYFFAKYVLPTAVLVLLLWFLIKYENEPITVPNYQNFEAEIARNVLFNVLYDKSDVLDIDKPSTVQDITPTNYYVSNNIQNHIFYRFIARIKPDFDNDFFKTKQSLNIWISQLLQEGFANVAYSFYQDLPYFTVFAVGVDSHHSGYLHIDIMPIIDSSCYEYLKNLEHQENIMKMGMNQTSLNDEDF